MILMMTIQTGEHSIASGTWNNVSQKTKRCDQKSYIPRFVHDLNDDDPDRRAQYWSQIRIDPHTGRAIAKPSSMSPRQSEH